MPDLVTRLKLTTDEFNTGIDSAKQKTKELQNTADQTTSSLQEMGNKGGKSAQDLLKEMNKVEGAGRAVSNYKRQLAQLQRTIADLTIGYRNMSKEMQNSEVGKEVAQKINELTQEAAKYKDAINDVNQEIKFLASDTVGWDAARQGIDALSASVQAFAAAGVIGEESAEKLVKIIAKLKAIEAASNAAVKIGTALQKNSALMAGISALQHAALAKAKVAETAATNGATIAQKAFNAVAKANPYVLLASAIIAVGAAIYAYTKHTEKARVEEEKQQKMLEQQEEAYNNYKSTISSAVGTVTGKFKVLQTQYKTLRTEMDKRAFIQDNADAFKELGLQVNNTNDADKIFIQQSEQVIAALQAKAKAAALQALYQEKYTKQVEAQIEAEKLLNEADEREIQTKATGPILPQQWREAGITKNSEYVKNTGPVMGSNGMVNSFELTPEGEQKIREYYRSIAKEAGGELIEQTKTDISTVENLWLEAEKNAQEASAAVSGLLSKGGTTTTKNKEEIEVDPHSLKAAQDQISALQKNLDSLDPNTEEWQNVNTQLQAWNLILAGIQEQYKEVNKEAEKYAKGSLAEANDKVKELQDKLNNLDANSNEFKETLQLLNEWKQKLEEIKAKIEENSKETKKYVEGSLAEANEKVKELQDKLNNLSPNTEEFNNILQLLNEWKKKQDEIKKSMEGTPDASITDRYQEIIRKAGNTQLKFDIGEIDRKSAKKEMKALNEELEKMGLKVRVHLEADMHGFDAFVNGENAVNSLYEAINGLSDRLEDAENGWEEFFAVFSAGIQIFDSVAAIIQTITTLTDILSAAKAVNVQQTNAEAAAAQADAAAQAQDAAATSTNAALHGTAAAMKGAESVASIPIVGAVLAVAAIAAIMASVIAAISSAKGFTNGGIVGGSSYSGDKVLARVNSHEMILNQAQQNKLWKFISSGSPAYSNENQSVTFRISGSDLVGTLNNYNKKISKL